MLNVSACIQDTTRVIAALRTKAGLIKRRRLDEEHRREVARALGSLRRHRRCDVIIRGEFKVGGSARVIA